MQTITSNTNLMDNYVPDTYGTYVRHELIDIDYESEDLGIDVDDIDINHDAFKVDLCSRLTDWYIEELNPQLPDYIQFVRPNEIKISSPKYYNYGADSMNIELLVDYDKLLSTITDDFKLNHFLQKYKSCDGFISYTPCNYTELIKCDDKERVVMCILNYLLDGLEIDPLNDFDSTIVYDNLIYPE